MHILFDVFLIESLRSWSCALLFFACVSRKPLQRPGIIGQLFLLCNASFALIQCDTCHLDLHIAITSLLASCSKFLVFFLLRKVSIMLVNLCRNCLSTRHSYTCPHCIHCSNALFHIFCEHNPMRFFSFLFFWLVLLVQSPFSYVAFYSCLVPPLHIFISNSLACVQTFHLD